MRSPAPLRSVAAAAAVAVSGLAALPPGAAPASSSPRAQSAALSTLQARLARAQRDAGASAGAYVVDLDAHTELYAARADTPRIPASVEKLATTSTTLRRLGGQARMETKVLGAGALDGDGVWRGDLYLRGVGDPTFGSDAFVRRAYGGGASVEGLAGALAEAGVKRVSGRIVGDESFFDRRRGVPDSGYAPSPYVGPLSALGFNRGLVGGDYQAKPARTAAHALARALERLGVKSRGTGQGSAPEGARTIAVAPSFPVATIVRLTNQPSDNYLAEMLIKGLGARYGRDGTTTAGARVVRTELRGLGLRWTVSDGSGLSRRNRVAPRQVVRLLDRMAQGNAGAAFRSSLPVAGQSGTLVSRMRGTAAAGRCRAKTGTLSNVSGLAGYCPSRDGHRLAFAFLMNRVSPAGARRLQDRMTVALARYVAG